MDKIYDTLVSEDQAKINAIVSSVREHLTIDGVVDVDLIMATLEQLNDVKREARDAAKKAEEENKKDLKQKAIERGKAYIASLKEGDMITFIYGPASFQKTATLPIEKKGAATVQVTYPTSMLGPASKTAKRNIHYDKIIVPDNFEA